MICKSTLKKFRRLILCERINRKCMVFNHQGYHASDVVLIMKLPQKYFQKVLFCQQDKQERKSVFCPFDNVISY